MILRKVSNFICLIVLFSMVINITPNQVIATTGSLFLKQNNLPFIENLNQYPSEVVFFTQLQNGTGFVTQGGEIVYSVNLEGGRQWAIREYFSSSFSPNVNSKSISTTSELFRLNPDKTCVLEIANELELGNLEKGIQVYLNARSANIEKIFIVKPGSRPEQISVLLDGIEYLSTDENGQLIIENDGNMLAFTKPVAFQEVNGRREYVEVQYTYGDYEYGFEVGDYDSSLPLIIDPMLGSTYLGGNRGDDQYEPSMKFSPDGNIIVTGYTNSNNFPTTFGVFDPDFNNNNTERFVSIFSPDLSTIITSTFIGGAGNEQGMGICTDDDGNVYVAGYTNYLNDFPLAEGGYVSETTGGLDAFILKLSSDLSTLLGSAVIGGSADEGFQWPRINVEVGQNGDVYIAGLTKSDDFPCTENAYDNTYAGGVEPAFGGGDAFLAKFSNDLTTLLSSTYIGSSGDEWRISMILDEEDNVYITGDTCFGDYPVTDGAYDTSFNAYGPGYYDMFISKLTSDLSTLTASTFLGSLGGDDPLTIKLDGEGNVYITGFSTYTNFPTTTGAYSRTLHGDQDIVVAKLSNDLSQLLASTYIGGTGNETGEDLVINEDGSITVSGFTTSHNFPMVDLVGTYDFDLNGGRDVILFKMNSELTTLLASTYVGGSADDRGQHLLADGNGDIYVVGRTNSTNFPTLEDSYDSDYNGGANDCFVFKIDSDLSGDLNSSGQISEMPASINILESYPNPFNSVLNVKYNLVSNGDVSLSIYDINGRKIKELESSYRNTGEYSHNVDFSALAAGTYFIRLTTDSKTITNKVMYVK